MPVPANLDAARAFALCLGLALPGERHWKKRAGKRLIAILDIPRPTMIAMVDDLEKADSVKPKTGPAGWLDLPELGGETVAAFVAYVKNFSEATSPEGLEQFGKLLEASPLPPDVLQDVLFPLWLLMSLPEGDPGQKARRFAAELFARSPEAFQRGLLRHCPYIVAEAKDNSVQKDTADISRELQAPSRVMYRLESARMHLQAGSPREAIEAALHAWSGAFEGRVTEVCSFIWFMAQPLSVPLDELRLPHTANKSQRTELRKGVIFKEAREWCMRESITFPFYDKLDKLRHSHTHEDYHIVGDSVELYGQNGAHLDTMTVQSLVDQMSRDVLFAWHFGDNLLWAETEHLIRSGRFERAWDIAVENLPDLAHAVTGESHCQRRPRAPLSCKRT